MSTPIVDPAWLAARNGLPADGTAVNHAQQAAQFLASHAITPVYAGSQVIAPAGKTGYGLGGVTWVSLLASDIDQPVTLPGGTTAIGRVTLPLAPAGNGADVLVSLYTDSSGSPGTLITSWTLPAAHLAELAAPQGLASGGPLATAQSNTLIAGDLAFTSWATPVTNPGSAWSSVAITGSGNYMITAGGYNGTTWTADVFTVGWNGGSAPGTVLPQPPLPVATGNGALVATSDILLFAGGNTTALGSAASTAVWTAGWDPGTGQVQAWSQGPSLPTGILQPGQAYDPVSGTVYLIGGLIVGSPSDVQIPTVLYATVANGQAGAWQQGPSLPTGISGPAAAVIGGWLVIAGGGTASGPFGVACAPVLAGGALGPWQVAPNGGLLYDSYAVTASGIAFYGLPASFGGSVKGITVLPVTADGPGPYGVQVVNPTPSPSLGAGNLVAGAFQAGPGTWELIVIGTLGSAYASAPLSSMPVISVPLPATGLTGGGTYHLVLHQSGGTAASYVQVALDPSALPAAAKARPASGGPWTAQPNGYAVPASVYDQAPGGQPLHLWSDSGARVTTLLWSGTGSQLLGALEATAMPAGPLNPNPYFAGGSGAGWTGLNGTFSVTGSPPAGAPHPFAGLFTATGSGAAAMEGSGAPFPVTPGQWIQVTADGVWTSTGTAVIGVDWLTPSGAFLSTSTATASFTPSAWRPASSGRLTAPAGAAFAYPRVGTAAGAGNAIYAAGVAASLVPAPLLPAVTQVAWNAAGQPSGTVQLA